MAGHESRAGLWLRRLGWMLLFWVAGVLALGVVALLLRLLMNSAGLTA